MTPNQFRKIALSMVEAVESSHMGHPDFRVRGKIFATLFTRDDEEFGMVKLAAEQQRSFVRRDGAAFEPVKGGWGRRGCTQVRLRSVDKASLRDAIFTAWCNTAPKGLIEKLDSSG